MQSYLNKKNFKMAQQTIEEIKALKGKKGFNSIYMTLKINNILLTHQMNLYNLQGKFDKSLAVFEDGYEKNKDLIERSSKEAQIKFYFNASYTLFMASDYKNALYFINIILNDNEQQLRQDIYSFARILNLLLHFELTNYDYLEYSSNSAIRYLNKTKRDHQIEKVFIRQIKKIAKTATQLETIPIYKETLKQINTLLEDENERVILDYIDVKSWLESKITGELFTDLVKQKVDPKT